MNKIIFFFLLASFSFGQNIELYLSLIEEGKVEGVKENLPELNIFLILINLTEYTIYYYI